MIRRAEVLAALSVAADSGMGHPGDLGLRTCLLASEIAKIAGLSRIDVADTFHLSLLRFSGCTAEAHIVSDVWGDEVDARGWLAVSDFGSAASVMGNVVKNLGADKPLWTRARLVGRAFAKMTALYGTAVSHCEVAQQLAARIGLEARLQAQLAQVFERWDGKGIPRKLVRDQTALPVRVSFIAHDVALFFSVGGRAAAVDVAERRSGGAHDPELVRVVLANVDRMVAVLEQGAPWDAVIDRDPSPPLDDDGVDAALAAVGDFADLRSNFTRGHSTAVAALAENAAKELGLDADAQRLARRAGLVHDLGSSAISVGVWDKPGPLTDDEREKIRTHAYLGERCLARAQGLKHIAQVAACAHERIDGSGYHRAMPGGALDSVARILSAADVFIALTSTRAHRAALSRDAATALLNDEVKNGRLDSASVRAVLAASGIESDGVQRGKRENPRGLSDREVEVLRLLAQGMSNKEMAAALAISAKTVDHHVQHIYAKIDVKTRAAATMFAMHERLVPTQRPSKPL